MGIGVVELCVELWMLFLEPLGYMKVCKRHDAGSPCEPPCGKEQNVIIFVGNSNAKPLQDGSISLMLTVGCL